MQPHARCRHHAAAMNAWALILKVSRETAEAKQAAKRPCTQSDPGPLILLYIAACKCSSEATCLIVAGRAGPGKTLTAA